MIINLSLFDIFRRTSPLYVYLMGSRLTWMNSSYLSSIRSNPREPRAFEERDRSPRESLAPLQDVARQIEHTVPGRRPRQWFAR
jgi:hypothetical protein